MIILWHDPLKPMGVINQVDYFANRGDIVDRDAAWWPKLWWVGVGIPGGGMGPKYIYYHQGNNIWAWQKKIWAICSWGLARTEVNDMAMMSLLQTTELCNNFVITL